MAWEPEYITTTQLAEYSRANSAASASTLATAVSSSSRVVDKAAGRQFGFTDEPEARDYTARWSQSKCAWFVETDDFDVTADMVISFDSVADGTFSKDIDLSGIVLDRPNAVAKGRPWTGFYLRRGVSAGVDGRPAGFRVLNTWGWSTIGIPSTVVDATKLQGSRFIARRDSPFGVAGSPDNGSELRLLAKADPDVIVMLRPYARKAWAR